MCGEIDEEITVPGTRQRGQFVSAPRLCLFLFPTKEEEEQLDQLRASRKFISDSMFCEAVRTYVRLDGTISKMNSKRTEVSLSATLIFLRHKGIEFPKQFQQLLGRRLDV